MAKIGNVEFNVISESRNYTANATSHAVERGSDITDHVKVGPLTYSIDGFVGDDDNPGAVHGQLVKLFRSAEPVNYVGRSMLNNCVIKSLTTNVDSSSISGFNFSMTITEIKVAEPSTVSDLPTDLKTDTASVGNAGRVQTM